MRKVLVSLLVLAMVLGLVGSVSAAYTDTTGNKYIDKVTAFGWMQGYPDGTFKPTGNITRAEASAVIVRALGLQAAADAAKGLGTKFSDVAATHWASGYINVCTTKGVLKGYPDGTFKPEANITGAEIITMIVRALNREYQAVGEWPIGHITVAAAEKIIGSGFISSALATRGNVAEYAAKASEVIFGELTTNGWVIPVIGGKNFATSSGYDYNTVAILVESVDTTDKTINGTWKLIDNYIIGGGIALKDLVGYSVKIFLNEDDQVVFVEPTSKTTTKTGQLRMIGADYFYLYDDTAKYTLAAGAEVYRNGVLKAALTDLVVDDNVEFFRDTAGKVTTIKATVFDVTHRTVLSTYTAGDVSTWSIKVARGYKTGTPPVYSLQQATYYLNSDSIVKVNGTVATLKEVKEDMVCSIQTDGASVVKIVDATDKMINGAITAKRQMVDEYGDPYYYITVAGVEYRLESNVWIENTAIYHADNVFPTLGVNNTISAVLSIRNRVAFVTEATVQTAYGKISAFNLMAGTNTFDKWTVDIKGVSTVYEIAKDGPGGTTGASLHAALVGAGITSTSYIKIHLDENGRIDLGTTLAALSPVAPVQEIYTSDKLVKIGGAFWSVPTTAVIYMDGVYSTSLTGVAKDNMCMFVPKVGEPKLELFVVDTYAKLDMTKVFAQAGWKVGSLDKAVEPGALVEVFKEPAFTTPLGSKVANGYGNFSTITLVWPLPAPTTTQTVYIRVTDTMGMVSSGSITVYP